MIFYIYKFISIIIATITCIFSWKVTHYFIKEIDKFHYVKGYVDSLKFPKKITYYISQILIFCGLAIVPIFIIGQGMRNERMKKSDRLLAYNLYIAPLIGIGGYGLLIYLSMLLADYYDLAILSRTLNLLGVYMAFFLVPYYVILGIKRLYRLNRNDTIQITKLGYKKENGIKKKDYLQKLFSEKLESETEEEFEIRRKEISRNWHYIYASEEEWQESEEVKNNFTRIQPLFIKLVLIYVIINFVVLVLNYEILGSELVSIEVYNKYIYQGVKFVYVTEAVILMMFLINYWLGRPFKDGDKYLKNNILSKTNIVALIPLYVIMIIGIQMFTISSSPVREDGTIGVLVDSEWKDIKADEKGINFIKSNYIERVRHQRDYESFTPYEKTLNMMKHPKKFEKAIQKVGQDRVDSFGNIIFQSDNALDKSEKYISIYESNYEINFEDAILESDYTHSVDIYFGRGEPEICPDDIDTYDAFDYNNENICALEQDMIDAVESLYTEVFDDKMLGIKSDYVGKEEEEF
ncbi:MAG: hypothetical protein ACK5MV_14585 [Aminipila sp.]